MKLHALVAALLLPALAGAVAPCWAQQGDPPKEESGEESVEDRVDRLVRQLAHPSYSKREEAQQALQKIGRLALPALREAAKSKDPEVASRASEAIAAIGGGGGDETREREQPERRGPDFPPPPRPGPAPGPDKLLEELTKQLPKGFGQLFERLFEGELQPRDEQTKNGRVRVWTWGNRGQSRVTLGRLGLSAATPGAALRAQLELPEDEGLVVEQLADGGHAAQYGIERYDILLAVDRRPLRTPADLMRLAEQGGKVELVRKTKRQVITLPPAGAEQPPVERPRPQPQEREEKKDPQERSF